LEIKKFYRISLRKKTRKTIPDDQLAELLKEKGYPIARRTIKIWRTTDIPWLEWGKRYKTC
jgi:RNA polymerase sigma-54 factor